MYKGAPKRLLVDFSSETLQARSKQNDILKVLKERNLKLRISYLVELCRIERKVKILPDKQKLREFITTMLDLQ